MKPNLQSIQKHNQDWLQKGSTEDGGHDFIHDAIPDLLAYITHLEAELERKEKGLKEIEWQQHGTFCYVCGQHQSQGHASECPIGTALHPIP